MQAILGPDHLPQTQFGRTPVRRDYRPIPHRYFYVLSLHLKGMTQPEIAELTGYAVGTISQILGKEEVIQVRQQLLARTQDEFEALFSQVVDTIRETLKYGDTDQKLQASEKWLKAHGKYQPNQMGGINVTAEDVVIQILNQRVSNE